MDELADGFRTGLRRIDTLVSPLPAIDPDTVVARAAAQPRLRRQTTTWLAVAAAVALVAGVGVSAWLASRGSVASVYGVPDDAAAAPMSPGQPGEWVSIAPSPLAGREHASGVWVDGRYLLLGGEVVYHSGLNCPPNALCVEPATRLSDGALYRPATNSWTLIPPVRTMAGTSDLVALGSSAYLLAELDEERAATPILLRYDTAAGAWSSHPLPGPGGRTLVATADRVVVVGGTDEFGEVSDYAFDPATARFTRLPDDPLGLSFNRRGAWVDGRLVLAGQALGAAPADPGTVRLAELDGRLANWRDLGATSILGSNPTSAGGRVVWPGTASSDGEDGSWGRSYFDGGIFDPATRNWRRLPKGLASGGLPAEVDERSPALVCGDLVAVAGNLLDPATLAWTEVPPVPGGGRLGTAFVGGPEGVLAWGGSLLGSDTSDGFLFRVPNAPR